MADPSIGVSGDRLGGSVLYLVAASSDEAAEASEGNGGRNGFRVWCRMETGNGPPKRFYLAKVMSSVSGSVLIYVSFWYFFFK